MKEKKKPPCFGDCGNVKPIKCKGCKFVLSCYFEWARKEKMRRAEEPAKTIKSNILS